MAVAVALVCLGATAQTLNNKKKLTKKPVKSELVKKDERKMKRSRELVREPDRLNPRGNAELNERKPVRETNVRAASAVKDTQELRINERKIIKRKK